MHILLLFFISPLICTLSLNTSQHVVALRQQTKIWLEDSFISSKRWVKYFCPKKIKIHTRRLIHVYKIRFRIGDKSDY